MSLLDDVSIVVTPNGYKAGELYAVVPVPTEGADVIVDGNFPDGSTAWALNGWTISGNAANCSGITANLIQTISGSTKKQFLITFTISNYVSGSVIPAFVGGNPYSKVYNANGTFTEVISSYSDTRFVFYATSFDGSISNVSVKEYTAADMDVTRATAATRVDEAGLVNYAEVLGSEEVTNGDFATDANWTKNSGWTISGGSANCDGTQTGNSGLVQQNGIAGVSLDLQIGKQYKMVIDVTVISGAITYIEVASDYQNDDINATGVSTLYFSPTSTNDRITIAANSTFVGSVNSVSVKEVTRDNVPRIDYSGGGCPHILAEPQRTNLVTYSEDFTNAIWNLDGSNVNLTRTSNATTSPSGEENATKLIGNNISKDASNSYIGVSTSATAPYTTSIFAKKGEYDYLVSGIGSYAGGYYAIFNLSNGTVSTSPTASGTTASIEDFGNGWYRCLVSTTNTGGGEFLFITPSVDGTLTTNYTNTTNGIYVYGGQVENGSYATSIIPTSGSTVTRNQDQFTRDGIGSLINSTEGVLFLEIAALSLTSTLEMLSLSDGTYNNVVLFRYYDTSSNDIQVQVKVGGSAQASMLFTLTDATDFNKIAFKYKENDFALWVNGTEVATDTSGNTFTSGTLNKLAFERGDGGNAFFGKVKQLQVYKTALTDEQLIQLTGTSGTDFYESYAEMASALTYTIQ